MNIGWPEGIWLGLAGLTLLGYLLQDGKPKEGNWSLGVGMLNFGISFGLLWWGGFFA
jgi:hypothetical protein